MDAVAAPAGVAFEPGFVSLAALPPGTRGLVVGVGSGNGELTSLERRLLELGFVQRRAGRDRGGGLAGA